MQRHNPEPSKILLLPNFVVVSASDRLPGQALHPTPRGCNNISTQIRRASKESKKKKKKSSFLPSSHTRRLPHFLYPIQSSNLAEKGGSFWGRDHGSPAAASRPRGGEAAGGAEEDRGGGGGGGGGQGRGEAAAAGGGGEGDQGRRPRAGGEAAAAAAAALLRAGHAVGVAGGGEAAGGGRGGAAEVLPQHGVRHPDAEGGAPRCLLQGAQLRHLQVSIVVL